MTKKQREVSSDSAFSALQVVHNALAPLTSDERAKVLTSVMTLLEIQPQAVKRTSPEASSTRPEAPVALTRPVGLVELMKDRKPTTNIGKITLFAYYREKHEGRSRFSPEDLKTYFGKAHEAPPALYGRDFKSAVRKGWLHEDGADSYITSKGIEEVEGGFPDERRRAGKARGKDKAPSSRRAKKSN